MAIVDDLLWFVNIVDEYLALAMYLKMVVPGGGYLLKIVTPPILLGTPLLVV